MLDKFEWFSLTIAEISRYWHKIAAEELEGYGLRGSHAIYLTAMARVPEGVTAPQLCEKLGKDKADVSRMMNMLIGKGLALKQGGHQNRYGGVFLLTEEGRQAAEHVCRRADLAVELAVRGLSQESRAAFNQVMDSIVDNLRQLSREGLPAGADILEKEKK